MNWLETVNHLTLENTDFALVTITRVSGSAPCDVGSKFIVTAETIFGTIGGGRLEQLFIEEARKSLVSGEANYLSIPLGAKTDQCCGGLVEGFIEVCEQKEQLYVFGAGHVGTAVAQVFSGTRFGINLIDERPEWINNIEIPKCAKRISKNALAFIESGGFRAKSSLFVIMTHSHELDFDILKTLLPLPYKYIGLIGSESKWKRFSVKLKQEGYSEEQISRVTCPIGASLHSKNPKEIAIALASELLSRAEK